MKKPSMTSFLIAFLLAAAVCTNGQEEVNDFYGDPVEVGEKYFILAVETASNRGGFLVPDITKTHPTCPLGITQTVSSYQVPVSFEYPFAIGRDTIDTSSFVNIEFRPERWSVCTNFSKLWTVDYSPSARVEPTVKIGGDRMSPKSAFKIEKATRGTYNLITSYGYVGAIRRPGTNEPQVIVTKNEDKALFVKFMKVDDDATTATITTASRVEKLGLRMFPFNIM